MGREVAGVCPVWATAMEESLIRAVSSVCTDGSVCSTTAGLGGHFSLFYLTAVKEQRRANV